jgi:hypothetical protein
VFTLCGCGQCWCFGGKFCLHLQPPYIFRPTRWRNHVLPKRSKYLPHPNSVRYRDWSNISPRIVQILKLRLLNSVLQVYSVFGISEKTQTGSVWLRSFAPSKCNVVHCATHITKITRSNWNSRKETRITLSTRTLIHNICTPEDGQLGRNIVKQCQIKEQWTKLQLDGAKFLSQICTVQQDAEI